MPKKAKKPIKKAAKPVKSSDDLVVRLKEEAKLHRNQLQNHDWKWRSLHELVAKFGRHFEPQPLPKGFRKGQPKLCFWNSASQALKKEDLLYVEGYGLLDGTNMPIHHAWLAERGSNMVIDRTAVFVAYFGIPFRTDYLRERWEALPDGVSLLDDWKGGFPLQAMDARTIRKLIED